MFPWEQAVSPITFTCPHCRDIKSAERGTVIVCKCPGARQQEAEDREKATTHHRSQEEARKARMKAANERRRTKDATTPE